MAFLRKEHENILTLENRELTDETGIEGLRFRISHAVRELKDQIEKKDNSEIKGKTLNLIHWIGRLEGLLQDSVHIAKQLQNILHNSELEIRHESKLIKQKELRRTIKIEKEEEQIINDLIIEEHKTEEIRKLLYKIAAGLTKGESFIGTEEQKEILFEVVKRLDKITRLSKEVHKLEKKTRQQTNKLIFIDKRQKVA